MAKNPSVEFTTPPGRMVWGSLYEPNKTDYDGNPLVIKSGVDQGKPTQRYEFGLALPKTQAHFANEPWGKVLWDTAHAAFPGGASSPAMSDEFSWKLVDGDSAKVSARSKSKIAPRDREGYKGHWVLTFSSTFAPKIYDSRDINNVVPLEGADAIVPGYVIQVIGTVAGNTGASPGIYLNHGAVGLRGYLPEIRSSGVDVSGKFGGALPTGASTMPVGGFSAPAAPAAAAAAPAPAPAPAAPPAAPAAAPVAVQPAPGLMGIPVAPVAPTPVPAAPPAPAKPTWATLAPTWAPGGWTEESARAAGHCS